MNFLYASDFSKLVIASRAIDVFLPCRLKNCWFSLQNPKQIVLNHLESIQYIQYSIDDNDSCYNDETGTSSCPSSEQFVLAESIITLRNSCTLASSRWSHPVYGYISWGYMGYMGISRYMEVPLNHPFEWDFPL